MGVVSVGYPLVPTPASCLTPSHRAGAEPPTPQKAKPEREIKLPARARRAR